MTKYLKTVDLLFEVTTSVSWPEFQWNGRDIAKLT